MSTYNPFSLEGKTILVTGASSGIGKATAIECAKMGATVILSGRNEERLATTLSQCEGDRNVYIQADLTEQKDMELLVKSTPVLDGVVLCAGKPLTLPFNFSTREKFDSVFNINFFSPVELLRLLSKTKKLNHGCSVVFMVSIGGTHRFNFGNAVYGASKAALQSMVRYCALELAGKLVRVNGISPGMVDTPLIHHGTISEEQMDADKAKYPLKRYGTPIDIAHGVIYLLSNASSWLTGQSIVIDGGITAR